mmetsp:Transcript_20207/g.55754  ORF Transcript_20207/g.55754 Transcript_20207/m.55754 type:complete len:283 (-) Transcript_20207:413-1261(-)
MHHVLRRGPCWRMANDDGATGDVEVHCWTAHPIDDATCDPWNQPVNAGSKRADHASGSKHTSKPKPPEQLHDTQVPPEAAPETANVPVVSNGRERHKHADPLCKCPVPGEAGKCLDGPLRVSHVCKACHASSCQHVVDLCGEVVACHLVPREVPELGAGDAEVGVVSAVPVAPVVAEPNIVSSIRQDVSQRLPGRIADVRERRFQKRVLQQYNGPSSHGVRVQPMRNPEEVEDVPISSGHKVGLDRIPPARDHLGQCPAGRRRHVGGGRLHGASSGQASKPL